MARNFPSWIDAYVKYAGVTEAPPHGLLGWCVRSCRCPDDIVWIDMKRFQWTPNFDIISVVRQGL